MITLQEVRKSFGSTVAVDGISMEVRAGETLGLLGPNGAGKTTTINMIMGMMVPDSGEIFVGDHLNPAHPQARRCIGVAPQSLSLYEFLTAEENLAFFARLYGYRSAELKRRVETALEIAELVERRKDRVSTFSGGMKRRLNLATALVHEPQVILLDEPTVGVDPQSRSHLFGSIDRLRSEGRTIVYTTHYMEEAQRLCDRVAIVDHGRLLDLDSVDALIARHGGRAVVRAELVRLPADPSVLPATPEGLSLRFESDRALEEVARLSTAGVEFQTLELTRPDLETVFLTLTGRSLRD